MTANRKSSGSNVALTVRKRKAGGSFVNIAVGKRRQSGAWVTIFSAAYAVTSSPGSSTVSTPRPGTISQAFTATVTGGTGPFTYSWAFVVGGTGITLSGATTSVCTASATVSAGLVDVLRQGTLRCTVTDTGAGGATTTTDVPIEWTFIGSA